MQVSAKPQGEAAGGWNVIVSATDRQFSKARRLFEELGRVRRTSFYNLFVVTVPDIPALLAALDERLAHNAHALDCVSRIAPAAQGFDFTTKDEFEAKARESALRFAPRLAGKSFYIRIRRRGHKGEIVSPEEERMLGQLLIDSLAAAGTPAKLRFEDPDAILAIDTVGDRAGLALWTRDDLRRYRFLKID